jgi:hypothetical protein
MIALTSTTPTARQPPRLPLRGNPHDFHSAVRGGNQQTLRAPQHHARVPGRHASTGKTELPLRIPIRKVQKNSAGKEMLAPPRVRYLSRGGPGGHCRYPGDQVPPRTSSRSRQKARHANHMPLRVVNLGVNRMAQTSSGAATCPAASAPTARLGAAPGPPRVLRPQLPLPGPGQLRGRHVSCDLSSRCPARGSSRAATCPAASAPAAQPGAAPGPLRILRPQLPLPSPGQLWGRHVCPGGPTVGVLLK